MSAIISFEWRTANGVSLHDPSSQLLSERIVDSESDRSRLQVGDADLLRSRHAVGGLVKARSRQRPIIGDIVSVQRESQMFVSYARVEIEH